MPLSTFTITQTLLRGNGTMHTGKVTISPNATIDDPDAGTVVSAWDVDLVDGAFTTTAPADGEGGVTGLAYTITYHLNNGRLPARVVLAQPAGNTFVVHQNAPSPALPSAVYTLTGVGIAYDTDGVPYVA